MAEIELASRQAEISEKLARLRAVLAERQFDGVQFHLIANTSWITAGGRTYVNEGDAAGPTSILVTMDNAYALTDSIEGPRIAQEEQFGELGFEVIQEIWHAARPQADALRQGKRIANDHDLWRELRDLRFVLQPPEIARLRINSRLAAEAINQAIWATKAGDTEHKLAARLAEATRERGGSPIVTLIASDERIYKYRHPLPTNKQVERYAMLVLCMRKEGLVVSITRLIHFGKLPDDLHEKALAVARVDAKMILGSKPGRTMQDMFQLARNSYEAEGYPNAINEHHQGGFAGYTPREAVAHPDDQTPIQLNQAFAWNPSISGAKSEDTVLLTANGVEVLTAIPGWPTWSVEVDGQTIERPVILEV